MLFRPKKHGDYAEKADQAKDENSKAPRRLPEKTRDTPSKPRRLGSPSDGIAKMDSYLIFVPRGKIGERVRVRTKSVSKKLALAERID